MFVVFIFTDCFHARAEIPSSACLWSKPGLLYEDMKSFQLISFACQISSRMNMTKINFCHLLLLVWQYPAIPSNTQSENSSTDLRPPWKDTSCWTDSTGSSFSFSSTSSVQWKKETQVYSVERFLFVSFPDVEDDCDLCGIILWGIILLRTFCYFLRQAAA